MTGWTTHDGNPTYRLRPDRPGERTEDMITADDGPTEPAAISHEAHQALVELIEEAEARATDPDSDDHAMLAIVLALAACDPAVTSGNVDEHGPWCQLCDAEPPGAASTLAPEQHLAHCPWRLAREHAEDLQRARRG